MNAEAASYGIVPIIADSRCMYTISYLVFVEGESCPQQTLMNI